MAITYSLQPDPQWRFFTLTGEIASGCKMYTYEAANHAVAKTIYQDPDGDTPWLNPVVFDSTGAQGPFYWAGDEPYYIVIEDADGNVLWTQDDFPTNAANTPSGDTSDGTNYILNSQFRLFPVESYSSPVPSSIGTLAFGGWSFSKTNTTATDTLSFQPFILGQTVVPNNPVYYVNYACTGAGSGETTKDIVYTFPDVGTFSNQEINLQLEGISTTSSSIEILINQHFGTGGSPSSDVETSIATIALTPTFTAITPQVFTPPTVAGKTLGTNDDDSFQLIFRMPLNTTCNVGLALPDLQIGDTSFTTQPVTEQQAITQVIPQLLALPSTVNPADGCYERILPLGSYSEIYLPRAGKTEDWMSNTAPSYALTMNGLPFFSSTYYNLANYAYDADQLKPQWGIGPAGFYGQVYNSTAASTNILAQAFAVNATASANGSVTAATDVNTGLGVIQTVTGTVSTPSQFTVFAKDGAFIPNSSYFLYNSPSTGYYLWFNNGGVDPLIPGRTGVPVAYTALQSAQTIATNVAAAIVAGFTAALSTNAVQSTCYENGAATTISDNNTTFPVVQIAGGSATTPSISGIVCLAGSAIVNGSWLYINSPLQSYYLWFNQNNKSVDPGTNQSVLSGKKGIKVVYTGTETAAQIAALVAKQISIAQFRLPDVRGAGPRYWQNGASAVLPESQQIRFTSSANLSGVNFTIIGLDEDGNSSTEVRAGPNNNTVSSVNTYSAITSITPSATNAGELYIGVPGYAFNGTPATVIITSTGNDTGIIFTIYGTDLNGNPQVVRMAGANATTATTSASFTSVTGIIPNGTTSTLSVEFTGGSTDGICLSQTGSSNVPLSINGVDGTARGICTDQAPTANVPLVFDGILSRDVDYYMRLPIFSPVRGQFYSATGDNTGSFQLDEFRVHTHTIDGEAESFLTSGNGTSGNGAGDGGNVAATDPTGGHESRGKTVNFNKIMYY